MIKPSIGATEVPGNGIDEDCDGLDGPSATYQLIIALINIYPNPTTDKFFIESEIQNMSFQIFNVQGVQIEQGELGMEIELSHLTAGVYFLKLVYSDGIESEIHKIAKI